MSTSSQAIRRPAVAGTFYPDRPEELRALVQACLADARAPQADAADDVPRPPKVLVVPHAGLVYSGPVAASAYALLSPLSERIGRVVMLGPAHRVAFRGLALSAARVFETPLGAVPVDYTASPPVTELPGVGVLEEAHAAEHCLEVQLPFLQTLLPAFSIAPVVVGDAPPAMVAALLERLWGGVETLILISTDLSHYHDYAAAQRIDGQTVLAIAHAEPVIDPEQACGCRALNGLLTICRARGIAPRLLDLRNSGDTAGPRDRVVGYAAFALA